MSEKFKILDITAGKGTKATGYLTVQDDDVGTVKLLVGVINGSGDGPVLCVTSGNYGTQYGGIDAIIRAFNEIDSKKLKGTMITVPVMNIPAFQKGVDNSPIDGLRLNHAFPGDPKGTITRRIAYAVLNKIVKKAQYHLDIRGGQFINPQGSMDFASSSEIGKKDFDAENVALVKILGLPFYVFGLYPEDTLLHQACKAGVHSLVVMGYHGFGTYDEGDIQKCKRGIYNLLKYLKMIEGMPELPSKITRMANETITIYVKHGGLLYTDVKHGDLVKKSQKLGEIRNLKGETLEVINAPADGYIMTIYPKHVKQPGEILLFMR